MADARTTRGDATRPGSTRRSSAATLLIAGIIGFFYSASFGDPGKVDEVFGLLAVNAWHNIVHILTGALGLLVAGYAAREYAMGLGIVYLVVAAWGFIIGSGESILSIIPVNTEDNILHLVLGLLGVGAGARRRRARKSTATGPGLRPDPVGQGAQAAPGLMASAPAHLEQHEGAGRDAARRRPRPPAGPSCAGRAGPAARSRTGPRPSPRAPRPRPG